MQLLLNAHALVDAVNEEGATALLVASSDDVTARLLDAGADPHHTDDKGVSALMAYCSACLPGSVQRLVHAHPMVVQRTRAALVEPMAAGEPSLWQRMMETEK